MLNLKNIKTKSKPTSTFKFQNCSYVCANHCAQLSYTTQQRTVLIIYCAPNLQTIIISQMLPIGTESGYIYKNVAGNSTVTFIRAQYFTSTRGGIWSPCSR